MANKKISALTGATTPLAGTETLPIVQSGATVQVSVANLTAGRSYTASAGVIGGADSATIFAVKGATKAVRFEADSVGTTLTGVDSTLVSSYQPLTIQGSTIPIYIAGVKAAEISTSGNYTPVAAKGINFTANTPAAGMTSQLLNWYEEGTWTPTFTTWAVAPTLDHATYTRIGRQVTLNMVMQGGTCVAGSSIGGLPFASGAAGGASVVATNANLNTIAFTGTIFNSTSSIAYISASTITSAHYWAVSCTYFT